MSSKRVTLSAAKQALLARRLKARGADALEPSPLARTESSYPVSSGQERLWFIDQYNPNTDTYNVTHGVRWRGPLDRSALDRAVRELVARHEALRARFEIEDGSPVQRIAPASDWKLDELELEGRDREAQLRRVAEQLTRRPFELSRGPLFRATLVRVDANDHVLLLVMHHAVTDGWSVRVLHHELFALYSAFAAGGPSPLAANRLSYIDYAAWQRRLLDAGHHDTELAYWKTELADVPALELPTDRPRPALQTHHGAVHTITLPAAVGGHGGADANVMENLVAALRANDPSLVLTSTAESLATHRIVFAAEQSRREGRVVSVDEVG